MLIWTGSGSEPARAQVSSLSLERLVEPSSVLSNRGEVVRFGLNFFIEFESLEEVFGYVDSQAGRWTFDSEAERKTFADDLLRRGVESRVVSMAWEDPREVLITHTREQLVDAVNDLRPAGAAVFEGEHWSLDMATYRSVFVELQERWKAALNCWSAAPSVPERVLSNWYIIPEGISLFGADYDSTEHFWQAVKYHPEVRLDDLSETLDRIEAVSWEPWLEALANDQEVYLEHEYTVEFLLRNLAPSRLEFFRERVDEIYSALSDEPVRALQQRSPEEPWRLRFTALEEKIFWGDLADVFHLLYFFAHLDDGRFRSSALEPVLQVLETHHFDGIYLDGYLDGKVDFIGTEFRQLMLEIWKVKFLEMERFREVIRSTEGFRLLHFLNDGDSPDIPIPVYVGFLEKIRELALISS
ncbi:MAG: hypothetical protein ACE5GX_01750 [Thermoanaerobaculia bacterium]